MTQNLAPRMSKTSPPTVTMAPRALDQQETESKQQTTFLTVLVSVRFSAVTPTCLTVIVFWCVQKITTRFAEQLVLKVIPSTYRQSTFANISWQLHVTCSLSITFWFRDQLIIYLSCTLPFLLFRSMDICAI